MQLKSCNSLGDKLLQSQKISLYSVVPVNNSPLLAIPVRLSSFPFPSLLLNISIILLCQQAALTKPSSTPASQPTTPTIVRPSGLH